MKKYIKYIIPSIITFIILGVIFYVNELYPFGEHSIVKVDADFQYIPVLYKDDLKYFDDSYIKKCLMYHSNNRDTSFFRALANEFRFHHVISDQIEKLYIYSDKVDNQGYDPISLYYVGLELYKKLIYEREKDGSLLRDDNGGYQISNRRKRDFAFFIKNYHIRKKNSPLIYNGSVGKMKKDDLIKARNELMEKDKFKTLELK
jgi:hypothetical protein